MMKKGIYMVLAVLAVFAMVMTGCNNDPGNGNGNGDTETKITLSADTLTVEVGESKQLTAVKDPADAIISWDSSDKTVATVNAGGWVQGVKIGTATITAEAEDGGKAACAVTVVAAITPESDVKVAGETLEHYTAKLVGVNHFGSDQGTTNADGSYTFDGTAGAWSGGGAQYTFPTAKANDTWSINNYALVEMHLKVTGGSVQVKSAKYGNNNDLMPYPSGSQYFTFDSGANGGVVVYKALISNAGLGIGFQRNTGGPATVTIEKVVFSKIPERTVTFESGGAPLTIPSQKVPDNTKVTLPYKPKWDGHTFIGWYDGANPFDPETLVTKDYTLTAKWNDTPAVPVDMGLNLDPGTWGTLPPNAANQSGGWTWPSDYAETAYADGVLTLTFNGKNRQRAIIPLNDDQIYELQDPDLPGITFRIDADVSIGSTGKQTQGEFRLHLGDPSATSNWNGTSGTTTGGSDEGPLASHLVEYRALANKSKATLGWFMIQAMYNNPDTQSTTEQDGFAEVTVTVRSVTIDLGDTTQ